MKRRFPQTSRSENATSESRNEYLLDLLIDDLRTKCMSNPILAEYFCRKLGELLENDREQSGNSVVVRLGKDLIVAENFTTSARRIFVVSENCLHQTRNSLDEIFEKALSNNYVCQIYSKEFSEKDASQVMNWDLLEVPPMRHLESHFLPQIHKNRKFRIAKGLFKQEPLDRFEFQKVISQTLQEYILQNLKDEEADNPPIENNLKKDNSDEKVSDEPERAMNAPKEKSKQVKFDLIEQIPSQILEVSEERVTMKCLVDATNRTFQIRSFDRLPLEGIVTLKVNRFVEIRIMTRPGERRFLFRKLSGKKVGSLFEEQNLFEGLANTRAFSGISPEK